MPHIHVNNEAELRQLAHLNHELRGKLWIYGLENVNSREAAVEANLAAKQHLKQLELGWHNNIGGPDADDQMNNVEAQKVLEGLCPPTDLETLLISGYWGSRYPTWLVDQQNNGPKNLHKLTLVNSSQLRSIPEHSELFTHLRSLEIACCNWDFLPDNMERLTSLKELILSFCNNILSFPTLPQSLERIEIVECKAMLMSWQKIEHTFPTKKKGKIHILHHLPFSI